MAEAGRSLKLALVIPGFQADPADWCIPAFTNLARELAKQAELHVFALRYPGVRRRYKIGRVYVHALGGGAFGSKRVRGASLLRLWSQSLRAIENEHRRGPFDAVMGIWATESGWLATRAAGRLGLPSLVHLAGGELARVPQIGYGNRGAGLSGVLVRLCLRAATLLTVPSGAVETLLEGRVPPGKYVRWHPGVDTAMFSPGAARAAGPFTFVTVGSLIPVKGHEWLLRGLAEAVRLSPESDLRLVVAGSGPLGGSLRELADTLGIGHRVQFAGEVPHGDLPTLYRRADAFLLGSWYEAECMAALEAMACGLPWVGPAVGALADVAASDALDGRRSGVLVPERTPRALAEAMLAVAGLPPEARETWGQAARERVLSDYEMQTQAERLLSLARGLQLDTEHHGEARVLPLPRH